MIIHYTKYAEKKFFLLQKHGRQIFKDEINEIIKMPSVSETKDKICFVKGLVHSSDEAWEIVFEKEDTIYKVLTFYPVAR